MAVLSDLDRTLLSLILLAVAASAASAEGVRVEDHGDGRYTLTTALTGTTSPQHGQLAIIPMAEELCGDLYPHYGRYRFESLVPANAAMASEATSLSYSQDIECHDTPQQTSEPASETVPPAPLTPPTDDDAAWIRGRTLDYLRAKIAADVGAAYAMLSVTMRSYQSPSEWTDAREIFKAAAGPEAAPTVVRITWYDDPANAPRPGRYVAADYRVDYLSDAFICGYVMWLRQADGNYLIVREEQGQVTPDDVAGQSAEQILMLRAQLQCRD